MHKCYHQLAYDERCQIGVLLSQGFSMRGIASGLNRSPATISREIACNRGGCGYRHGQAQAMASARGSEASGVPRKLTEALWRRITGLLGQGWSPEQVEGRLKRLGEETVGREWICRQVLQPCPSRAGMSSRDFGFSSMSSIRTSPISIRGFFTCLISPPRKMPKIGEDLQQSPDFPGFRAESPENSRFMQIFSS